MNISAVGNIDFGRLRYKNQNLHPTSEQLELSGYIKNVLDDNPASDYNLLENLENICGADVYVIVGDNDEVTLTARKINKKGKFRKIENSFYDKMNIFSFYPMKASKEALEGNKQKIQLFCNICKNFVNRVIESGRYIG